MAGKLLTYGVVVSLIVALMGGTAYILWHPASVEARGNAPDGLAGRMAGSQMGYNSSYGHGLASPGGWEERAVNPAWAALPLSDLSAEERAGLVFMREEEKLAHDVYLALYETWGLETFNSIAQSEQTHSESVLALLERYGISDPAAGLGLGEFSDPTLQALYTRLVAQGQASASEALKVGAYIEEVDMADLQLRLSQTDNADLQQVYTNLLAGSTHHMRAFVRVLDWQFGMTYEPQVLEGTAYQELISSTANTGPGAAGRSRHGR